MTPASTRYVGMDVHKESIAVACVAKAHQAEVIYLGAIGTRQCGIDLLTRKPHPKRHRLALVYDAGPCGYWLYRSLTKQGHTRWVVAPSLSPEQAGARVKTNRRGAIPWARLMRPGDPTPAYVPQGEDDAVRDLRRAREAALRGLKTATHRLKALLLRREIRYAGRASWGPAHLRWLSEVGCPTPAQQAVCQGDVRAVAEPSGRLGRLERERQDQVPTWRLRPVVAALQALRGVRRAVAATLVAGPGDLARFDKPRPLMSYRGLTPSESSTGDHRRRGGAAKTGNAHARRALIEGAWAHR